MRLDLKDTKFILTNGGRTTRQGEARRLPLSGLDDQPPQRIATTVPVPLWPGLGAYPGSVRTMTISGVSPERTVDPVWLTVEVTITAMYWGTAPTGGGLLPVSLDQPVPHAGGVLVVLAKPLKVEGAEAPELSGFSFDHWELQ